TGVPKTAETSEASQTLQKGLPSGATDPTVVMLHSTDGSQLTTEELSAFSADLAEAEGVASVGPVPSAQTGTLSQDGTTAMFTAVLGHDPSSDQALADVRG